jgi:hypothetical protein
VGACRFIARVMRAHPSSQRQDYRGRNGAPMPRLRQPGVMSVQKPEIAYRPGSYLSVGKRTLQPSQAQGILLSPRDTRMREYGAAHRISQKLTTGNHRLDALKPLTAAPGGRGRITSGQGPARRRRCREPSVRRYWRVQENKKRGPR